MIFQNMDFHNVAEIQENKLGYRLYRFPRALCGQMGEGESRYGRYVSQTTAGCELRFVLEGDRAMLSLTSVDEDGYVQIFRGDYAYYRGYTYSFPVKKGEVTHILLENSKSFAQLDPRLRRGSFSADVWRVLMDINCTIAFVDLESYGFPVRPPRPEEVPEKTLLCYGTSLTYGACATAHAVSYVQLLGRLLGCNVLNKAMGGSCMNEKGVADFFASGFHAFDGVLLENGVNMSGMAEAYEKNAGYLIGALARAFPQKPIYCVTAYPNSSLVRLEGEGNCAVPCVKDPDCAYEGDRILRRLAAQYPNCRLIEGGEIMDRFTDLTCDLVHMSDYGQIRTALNLSKVISL